MNSTDWQPFRSFPRKLLALWIALVFTVAFDLAFTVSPAAHGAADGEAPDLLDADRIQSLVEQLGHDKYVLREQAQDELIRIGAPALDALTSALQDDDVEVVMRAKYLLTAIRIEWAKDTDPPRVRELMSGYSNRSEKLRREIIDELAKTDGHSEVEVLCRIVRYEKSAVLAKWAAIVIMGLDGDDEAWAARVKLIQQQLGGSQRRAVQWLRNFVEHRGDAADAIAEWKKLTDEEQALWQKANDQTSYKIVQALLFRLVNLLEAADRRQEAEPYLQQIVDLQPDDEESVRTLVNWLLDKNAPRVIATVGKKYPVIFEDNPLLLYALAYSHRSQGNEQQAEEAVARALEMNASLAQHHLVVAYQLQERGWFDWSEREYNTVIKIDGFARETATRATFLLSEMLHDQQQEKKAADVVQELVKRMDSDPRVLRLVRLMEREPGSIRSRMHYFFALDYKLNGNVEKQIERLDLAIKEDPRDADVLIALYRLPDDDERRKRTLGLIRKAIDHFRNEIATTPDSANPLNQFAWLVGNTLGETDAKLGDQAIKYSHRSLEIRPGSAGYLDTLGRCYYARGDYKNAVKYQSDAVKLDPHSGLIRRQLEVFEAALDKSKQKSS